MNLGGHPAVRRALAERNVRLAGFWFEDPHDRARLLPSLVGRSVLVIDAEDTFTAMARHVLGALGLNVTVRRYDEGYLLGEHDLVILGPGPGDPRDRTDPKIARIAAVAEELLESRAPFFAVCLGHQILSTVLGLDVVANAVPHQGTQRRIDFFGRSELVGFYNTFSARSTADLFVCPQREGTVEVLREASTGEVHALRGPGFTSVQFHPASVLTRDGVRILGDVLGALAEQPAAQPSVAMARLV
jgi:2-amino-4-deoxychorismate synthase